MKISFVCSTILRIFYNVFVYPFGLLCEQVFISRMPILSFIVLTFKADKDYCCV